MVEQITLNEGNETLPEQREEMMLQTEKGAIRGELISQQGTERVIRTTWSRDGVGVGSFLKFSTAEMEQGEPLTIAVSSDSGQTYRQEQITAKLERAGRWKRGEYVSVEKLFDKTENRAESDSLPHNTLTETDEHRYSEAMPEYEHVAQGTSFAAAYPENAKCNFAYGNVNEGWKTHLNVTPEHVVTVSTYLKENGYAHKYLTGGVGYEGKAFTIYFGAKSKMDEWASVIAEALKDHLSRPSVPDEVEVSSGVVARFTSINEEARPDDQFLQYGTYGLSARRTYIVQHGGWNTLTSTEAKRDIAKDAYEQLSKLYGSYFHG